MSTNAPTSTESTNASAAATTQAPAPGDKPAAQPAVDGAAAGAEKPAAPLARQSDALARFAKKDREIYQREQRLKAGEADLASWTEAKELAAKDPLKFIEKFGVTYDGLTKNILGTIKRPEQEMRARLDKLEKERAEEQQQAQQAQYDRTLSTFKSGIATSLAKQPDVYELTLLEGDDGVDLVEEVIKQHWQATEEILDVDDAARMVESHLEEALEKRLGSKKLKSKLEAQRAAAQQKPNAEKQAPANSGLKTLSNRMTPGSSAPQTADTAPKAKWEIERDRLARATALLKDK